MTIKSFIKITTLSTFIALGLGVSRVASADATPAAMTYSYVFRSNPGGLSCNQQAQRLVSSIGAQQKLEIESVDCAYELAPVTSNPESAVYVIEIRFQSNQPLNLVQTKFGHSDLPGDPIPSANEGVFESFDACLNQVAAQKQLFENLAQQKVLSVVCEKSDSQWETSYAMKFFSIGEPKQRLYVLDLKNSLNLDASNFASQASAWLNTGDTKVALTGKDFVLYYSVYAESLSTYYFGIFSEASSCEAQKSEVQSILQKMGDTRDYVECQLSQDKVDDSLTVTSYHLAALRNGAGMLSSDFGMNSEKFPTMSSCLANVPATKARLTRNSPSFAGLICHAEGNSVVMERYDLSW